MKGIIAAALLTMPLSLFAQGGTEGGAPAAGTTPSASPAAMPAPAPTPAPMAMVACVGKKGAHLTDEQKAALKKAHVAEKTMKTWKAEDVANASDCKGAYTIENGVATKVMHKGMHKK